MPEEIVMPRLSDTMEEGTISQWLKREGETVHKGDAILEVETDKANMELQAYSDGVIHQIIHGDGDTVTIGSVIGILAKPGEQLTPATSPGAGARGAAAQTSSASDAPRTAASPGDDEGERAAGDIMAATPDDGEIPAPAIVAARAGASTSSALMAPEPVGVTGGDGTDGSNGAGGRVRATPLARNIAREHAIDLAPFNGRGSGPGGRIVKDDIERILARQGQGQEQGTTAARVANGAAETVAPPSPPPAAAASATPASTPSSVGDDTVELRAPNRIQTVMARRLTESKTTVPHFYVTGEIDMSDAAGLRKQLQETFGPEGKVSYNDLVVRACALTLRAMPEVNTSWRDGQFAAHSRVNVGIAVSLPDGLVVPVIHDADRKGLREISTETRSLAEKARAGKLAPTDMAGGTFTISNLGMYDAVEQFQAIINPPESAILAVGAIQDKPAVVDGQVVVRPLMRVSLSVDHRVIPGVPAAQFLQGIKRLLQEPLRLGF